MCGDDVDAMKVGSNRNYSSSRAWSHQRFLRAIPQHNTAERGHSNAIKSSGAYLADAAAPRRSSLVALQAFPAYQHNCRYS
jgi:hypothetical protein